MSHYHEDPKGEPSPDDELFRALSREEVERWIAEAEESRQDVEAQVATANDVSNLNEFDSEKLAGLRQDREQRKWYAQWCFGVLVIQLVFMNLLMWLVGADCLKYNDWLFHAYLIGTFGEVAAIVWVITSYLFPKDRPQSK